VDAGEDSGTEKMPSSILYITSTSLIHGSERDAQACGFCIRCRLVTLKEHAFITQKLKDRERSEMFQKARERERKKNKSTKIHASPYSVWSYC
jgi:hypothetical protein